MKDIIKIKGFTLVELMIVVAIMALLTGIVTANLSSVRAKSRDGKRISDMSQIQLALEQYFNRCGIYPAPTSNGSVKPSTYVSKDANNGCPSGITFGTFLSQVPKNIDGSEYGYYTDPRSGLENTSYVLYNSGLTGQLTGYGDSVPLETNSTALTDSLQTANRPYYALPQNGFSGISCYENSTNNKNKYFYCLSSPYLPSN